MIWDSVNHFVLKFRMVMVLGPVIFRSMAKGRLGDLPTSLSAGDPPAARGILVSTQMERSLRSRFVFFSKTIGKPTRHYQALLDLPAGTTESRPPDEKNA